MSEALRQGIEIWFDISYLTTVWIMVALMFMHRGRVASRNRAVATRVLWAFVLLGLGDAGHVGFRVFAYLNGGLEQHTTLVGIGALATAITVTIFYMFMLDAWRVRYDKALGWFGWTLMAVGVLRLGLMMPAVNQWTSLVPPMPRGIIRNVPLMIQGLGLAWLLFRDSGKAVDHPFRAIAWMILVSYACYIPVILFASTHPLLGMLMIPKTCAYLAVAFIAYNALFKGKHREKKAGEA
ncbi:MAG: hypothetical protein NTV26_01640 [Caldiserica bacterium]|nr:hypothetical protein [Caldisericota bacterium]